MTLPTRRAQHLLGMTFSLTSLRYLQKPPSSMAATWGSWPSRSICGIQ